MSRSRWLAVVALGAVVCVSGMASAGAPTIIETENGYIVEYSGNENGQSDSVVKYSKDDLDKKATLDENIGKSYWAIKSSPSFSKLPDCKEKVNLSKGQWFTIKKLLINSNAGAFFQLMSPKYEAILENKNYVCFSPTLGSGKEVSNSIDIFSENKNDKIVSSLNSMGISKGKTLWLKYPLNDFPAFTKMEIISISAEKDIAHLDNILIQVLADNKNSTLTTNSILTLSGMFYDSDPKVFTYKWSKKALAAIKNKSIFLGMTRGQAEASWGLPETVNRTVGKWGVHEQWVYEKNYRRYLYFKNDELTGWQD